MLRRLLRFPLLLATGVMLFMGGCSGCSCFDFKLGSGGDVGCNPNIGTGVGGGWTCTCPDGSACNDLGACGDTSCAYGHEPCGGTCCGEGLVCWKDECVYAGDACASTRDCDADQICDYSAAPPFEASGSGGAGGGGGAGGASACASPSPMVGRCMPAPVLASCEAAPDPASGTIALGAAWGDPNAPDASDSVVAQPLVVGPGPGGCDSPMILALTSAANGAASDGTLRAFTLRDGSLTPQWSSPPPPDGVANDPLRGLAAARVGDGSLRVVVCTVDGRLRAYDGPDVAWTGDPTAACDAPAIARLGGEITVVTASETRDLGTGAVLDAGFDPPMDGPVVAVDVDTATSGVELVSAGRVYRDDGTLLADAGITGSYVGVADLDGDHAPEIVVVQSGPGQHHLAIYRVAPAGGGSDPRAAGARLARVPPRSVRARRSGRGRVGGPPVLADLDGDGLPDVGVATARGYVALRGAALVDPSASDADTQLWAVVHPDCAFGRRGSTAFDFDADGKSDIVYADGSRLSILAGPSGDTVFSECDPAEPSEGAPVIADADGDGVADLLAVASSRTGVTCAGQLVAGLRIYGHTGTGWARTRPVWNEEGYHVVNVDDDGSLSDEGPFYSATSVFNRFRSQPADRSAPDLVLELEPKCDGALVAHVSNDGQAAVDAGDADVIFASLTPSGEVSLGTVALPVPLAPGATALVEVAAPTPLTGLYQATIAPRPGLHWAECSTLDDVDKAVAHCTP